MNAFEVEAEPIKVSQDNSLEQTNQQKRSTEDILALHFVQLRDIEYFKILMICFMVEESVCFFCIFEQEMSKLKVINFLVVQIIFSNWILNRAYTDTNGYYQFKWKLFCWTDVWMYYYIYKYWNFNATLLVVEQEETWGIPFLSLLIYLLVFEVAFNFLMINFKSIFKGGWKSGLFFLFTLNLCAGFLTILFVLGALNINIAIF